MKTKTIPSLLAVITACAITSIALGEGDKQRHADKGMKDKSTIEKVTRTTEQQVDHQLTAKDLIGKDIYDNTGEEIGPVVDVILAGQTSSALQAALSDQGNETGYNSTTAIDPETGSPTYAANDPATTNDIGETNDERAIGDAAAGMASDMRDRMASMMPKADEACAVVSYGGVMGIGNDLIIVPISALNYNRDSEQVTLNVNETELDAMVRASANAASTTDAASTSTSG